MAGIFGDISLGKLLRLAGYGPAQSRDDGNLGEAVFTDSNNGGSNELFKTQAPRPTLQYSNKPGGGNVPKIDGLGDDATKPLGKNFGTAQLGLGLLNSILDFQNYGLAKDHLNLSRDSFNFKKDTFNKTFAEQLRDAKNNRQIAQTDFNNQANDRNIFKRDSQGRGTADFEKLISLS